MFPTIKPELNIDNSLSKILNQQDINVKLKQKQWNQRFAVSNGIPEYAPLKDKHTKSYKKILQSAQKKKSRDESEQYQKQKKYQKKTWTRKKNDTLNQRLENDNVQNNTKLNGMIKQLQKIWHTDKIPDFYCYFFALAIKQVSLDKLEQALSKQIRTLRNRQSYYHEIMKSVEARQSCIAQIRKCLEGISNLRQFKDVRLSQDTSSQLYQKKLRILQQQINHYRKLTLYIIDKVKKWKEYLKVINENQLNQSPIFLYNQENYIIKILNDTNFVAHSIAGQFLNLASKNDPFFLRPLKDQKTESNQYFYQAFQIDEETKKKMIKSLEFLASEKVQQLKNYYPENKIKPSISNAYKQNYEKQKKKSIIKEFNYQTDFERKDDNFKTIQKQKQRIQRLQKNQQRINAIKNIYEPKKFIGAGTDTENQVVILNAKLNMKKNIIEPKSLDRSKSLAINKFNTKIGNRGGRQEQTQFDSILKTKEIELLKQAGKGKNLIKDKLSNKKKIFEDKQGIKELQKIINNYNQNKIVSNVKEMQLNIKNKIQLIKQEDDNIHIAKNMSATEKSQLQKKGVSTLGLKPNDQLIKQLKTQIMHKLQKQAAEKQKSKKQQRQQQQKLIEQMKQKLRRDLEQKLKQERKKKQLQREILEKKLKQQQSKLSTQRQLELELQLKLSQEKQLSQMEKIKKNILEKEKQLRAQISNQQRSRKIKQLENEKSKLQKLKLIEQLSKNNLKTNVEDQLKKQIRQKMIRQVNFDLKSKDQVQKLKNSKQDQLQKQLKTLKIKQAMQLQQLKKENEIKDQMLRQKLQLEQKKKVQLQLLIKQSMQNEKMQLQKFAYTKRKQMENQLRENIKYNMLNQIKNQKLYQYQQNKKIRQKQIQQETYRQKIREKLERQMRIELIQKSKKQLQEKQIKKRQISTQLQRAQRKLQQKIYIKPLDREQMQKDVKKQIIEKSIIQKKLEKESAKNELRSKFEKQLLSSGIPQIYNKNEDFLIKNINMYKQSNYFQPRLEQQEKYQPENSKNQDKFIKSEITPITQNQSPNKTSNNLTVQQFQKTGEKSQQDNNSPQRYSFGLLSQIPQSPQKNKLGIFSQFPQSPDKMSVNSLNIESPIKKIASDSNQQKDTIQQMNKSIKGEQKANKLGMSPEQYQVYMKKKSSINSMRKNNNQKFNNKNLKSIEQDEQQKDKSFKIVKVKVDESRKKAILQQEYNITQKKGKKEDLSSNSEQQQKKKKTKTIKKTKKQSQSDKDKSKVQQQSEQQYKKKIVKRKNKNKKKSETEESEQQQQVQQRKKKSKKNNNKKKKNKLTQSQSEQIQVKKKKKKVQSQQQQQKKNKKSRKKNQSSKKQFQTSQQDNVNDIKQQPKKKKKKSKSSSLQEQQQQQENHKKENKKDKSGQINNQPSNAFSINSQLKQQRQYTIMDKDAKSKFKIQVQAVQEGQLDQYLQAHFAKIPKQQLDIFVLKRQELYRKLLNQLTFTLFVGKIDNKSMGLCIVHHQRTKEQSRKFVINHISTYKNQTQFDFIINICNYIFKKDPTDEIQFLFQFDESKQQQLSFSNQFNSRFDKYGTIFQKKISDEKYERKYIMKRPFNLKCQVSLGMVSKQSFSNLCTFSSAMLFSNLQLYQNKQQNLLKGTIIPEREMSYSIMICQIFRSCLTPQQAQTLKIKVKQYLKLKQLLVLVVMLEKKKVKLDQLKLSEFKSITELNMKLLSQGKQLIKMVKDSQGAFNRLFFCQFNQGFKLPFHFQTTTLPLEYKDQIQHINYFRLSSIGQHKLYIIKSSLYNAQMHILPTENPKYKLFLMSAAEYNQVKQKNNLDLFMYIRVFLKNVKSHNTSNWKYVWVPEMSTKGYWAIREFRSFLDKDIYTYDSINISYKQFIPGSLIIQPDHKDLVITPPFILGILSVTLEQVSQGSPLYARLLDTNSLKVVEVEQN